MPWSIRKVLDNIPSDKGVTIHDKMVIYIKDNLILENKDGKVLTFEKAEFLKEKKKEGHHSMVNYKIYFRGDNLFKVTNTIICDYFEGQSNYYILYNQPSSKITNKKNSYFIIGESTFKLGVIKYVVIILLSVLAFIIYKEIKNRTSN